MSQRFYSSDPLIIGDEIELQGSEHHHLAHVMRVSVDDDITLFDGRGDEFGATVRKLGKRTATLEVTERRRVDCELPVRIHLAVALPKGDRQRWMVEKLVELGVSSLTPIIATRGVANPNNGVLNRLRRTVIEASKQCGRNRLMEITVGQGAVDFFIEGVEHSMEWNAAAKTEADDSPHIIPRLLAHPNATPGVRDAIDQSRWEQISDIWVAVGPEGGWTDEETEAAREHRWQTVQLGKRILRIETASVYLASCLGELLPGDSPFTPPSAGDTPTV